MILQALTDYYERCRDDLPPIDYAIENIDFVLTIREDGSLAGIDDVRELVNGKPRSHRCAVPFTKRTRGVKAKRLWDNPEYVLGVLTSAGEADARKKKTTDAERDRQVEKERELLTIKHLAFRDAVDDIGALIDDAGVTAIQRFLGQSTEAVTQHPSWDDLDAASPSANLAFRLEGTPTELITDRPAIRQAIAAMYDNSDGPTRQCLITGDISAAARLHPSVKGIAGGQLSGTSLVSFNFASAESFAAKQGDIAPVSRAATFRYSAALQSLVHNRQQSRRIGDMTLLFWADRATPAESQFADWFDPPTDDPAANTAAVQALHDSVWSGGDPALTPDTRFFLLGLGPNAGRLVVRLWHTGPLDELAKSFRQHFDDFDSIHNPDRDHRFIPMWRLMKSLAPRGDVSCLPPDLPGRLVEAVLSGGRYPRQMLSLAIERTRKEQVIDHVRAATLRAYLERQARINQQPDEGVTVALDRDNNNAGYRLGRLFATLERIQQRANPNLNRTIRERYYGAAASTPLTVFPHLLELKNHHLQKLAKTGFFDQTLDEIVDGLIDIPAQLLLEDQARFAIGYHHQRQEFWRRRDELPTEVTEETSDE